jgi:flagellar basal body-associated protein FliL
MEKITKILGLVARVLVIIVLAFTVVLSLTMAYIMFAPDSYPKPFYLFYTYPVLAQGGTGQGTAGSATATPTVVPVVLLNPGEGIMLNTGSKIINLQNPDSTHKYVRVTVVVEFNPKDPTYSKMTAEAKATYSTAFSTELAAKQPMIDDTIIALLSSKNFEALYTAAGKEALRKELLQQINSRLPDYTAISVYFTEFVVD